MPGRPSLLARVPRGSRVLLLALLPALLPAAPAFAGSLPWEVRSHTLDNGLDVHVVPMPSPGVVAWQAWVDVGSGQEVEEGRTGFAHFFEHLMFFGSEDLPLDARERTLLRMGIEENAWTWVDQTVYHAVLPASQLDDFAALEADRFLNLALSPDDVRREAGAVQGEFRKGRSDPYQQLYEGLMATAFQVHPYRHDTIGYEADIAAMPGAYDDAMRFFDVWYRPEHTSVVIAGDVDPEAVFALVERHWGGWEPGAAPPPEVPVEPEPDGPRWVEVPWPVPTAPRLVLAWRIPAHDPDATEVAALELAADLLLAPDGPLQRRLVHEGLAYGIAGGRDMWAAPGLLRIEVILTKEDHLAAAESIVKESVAGLAATEPDVLATVRDRDRYALLTSLDDPATVAHTVGEAVRLGGSPDAIDRFQQRYATLEVADLAAAVDGWLVDERLTVAVLRPDLPEKAPEEADGDAPAGTEASDGDAPAGTEASGGDAPAGAVAPAEPEAPPVDAAEEGR